MEQRIKDYEQFIAKAAKHPTKELATYHQEMIQNFQHERAIHLAVTLFFCTLALIATGISAVLAFNFCYALWSLTPFFLSTLILTVLSIAYVRHYYFLENHIQKLYDYNKKLHLKEEKHEQ